MSTQFYIRKNFQDKARAQIDIINAVIDEYIKAGYRITARQLYYQLVARGHIPNTERSYQNTTRLINDAKLAGLMDWDAIEDRTREFISRARWSSAADIISAAAHSFHMDMWENQACRVFCIVEKEALAGVLERACNDFDVPLLAARGYPSGTVMREFCKRDINPNDHQDIHVLHLGDHDPSGIDMTRDLDERIRMFSTDEVELHRIALTMTQIKAQKPPPNPAKMTDSRFEDYERNYGTSSWELDALSPQYLDTLVRGHIAQFIDQSAWAKTLKEIERRRKALTKTSNEYSKGSL